LKSFKALKASKSLTLAGLSQRLQKLKIGQACVPASVHAAASCTRKVDGRRGTLRKQTGSILGLPAVSKLLRGSV